MPTSHVVRGTGVEVPIIDLVIIGAFAEEGVGTWFIEVEVCRTSRHGKRKAWTFQPLSYFLLWLDTPVHQEQSNILLPCLHNMSQPSHSVEEGGSP